MLEGVRFFLLVSKPSSVKLKKKIGSMKLCSKICLVAFEKRKNENKLSR